VYALLFPGGKAYVGRTNDLRRRLREHRRSVRARSPDCKLLAGALHRYGWGACRVAVLADGLTPHSARRFERRYIRLLGSAHPGGYNLAV
jgi:hypothetical protein